MNQFVLNNNNDKIAKFMDVVFYDDENKYYHVHSKTFMGEKLLYHNDWNWLMPVAQRCYYTAGDYDAEDWMDDIQDAVGKFNLELVYETVLNFINWQEEIANCAVCSRTLMHDDECYVDVETGEALCDEHSWQDGDGNAHRIEAMG